MGPRMVAEDAAELKIVTSLNDVNLVSLSGFSPRRVNDVKLQEKGGTGGGERQKYWEQQDDFDIYSTRFS